MTLFAYLKPTLRYEVVHPQRWTYTIEYSASGPDLYKALKAFVEGPNVVNQLDSDRPSWFSPRESVKGTRIFKSTLFPAIPIDRLCRELWQALVLAGYPADISHKLAEAIVDERAWFLYARTRTVRLEHWLASWWGYPKVVHHCIVDVKSLEEQERRLKEEFRNTLHWTPFLGAMLQGAEVLSGRTVLGDDMRMSKRAQEGIILLLSIAIPRIPRPATADHLKTIHPKMTRRDAEAVLKASRRLEPHEKEFLRQLANRRTTEGNLILSSRESSKLSELVAKLREQPKDVVKARLSRLVTVDDAVKMLSKSGDLSGKEFNFIAQMVHRLFDLSKEENRRLRDLLSKLEEPKRKVSFIGAKYRVWQEVLISSEKRWYKKDLRLMELGGAVFLKHHLQMTIRVLPEGQLSRIANRLTGADPNSAARSADYLVGKEQLWDFYSPTEPKRVVQHILLKKRTQTSNLVIDLDQIGPSRDVAEKIARDIFSGRNVGRSIDRLVFVTRRGTKCLDGERFYDYRLIADLSRSWPREVVPVDPLGPVIRGGGGKVVGEWWRASNSEKER